MLFVFLSEPFIIFFVSTLDLATAFAHEITIHSNDDDENLHNCIADLSWSIENEIMLEEVLNEKEISQANQHKF